MKFSELENHISAPRLSRYLTATAGNKRQAIKAYKLNLKLAQSFHPLLGLLEVILRNHINQQLSAYFHDNDWIINQKRGFMSDRSLRGTNLFLRKSVEKAEQRLARNSVAVTSGKIIAEQTFGFWTSLFETHHYRLIGGRSIRVFAHLPPGVGRKRIFKDLEKVREFRNRINHNEPICFDFNTLNFDKAEEVRVVIGELLTWIDPQIPGFYKSLDNTLKVISKGRLI